MKRRRVKRKLRKAQVRVKRKMPNSMFFVTSIIDEWGQKLSDLADKYLNSPSAGFIIFSVLLILGFWAVTSFSQK